MKNYPELILRSTEKVMKKSKHVSINIEAIKEFCGSIELDSLEKDDCINDSPFPIYALEEKERKDIICLFNSISFSYWGDTYWQVTHKERTYERGSWSLLASIFRAKEENIDILNPSFQADMKKEDLEYILRGNIRIPLLEERLEIVNEIGTIIRDEYNNSWANLLSKTDDAVDLLSIIIETFPLFEDSSIYKNEPVYYFKRAQALVEGLDYVSETKLTRIDELTALSDYILPMISRDNKMIEYDEGLAHIIDTKQIIPADSEYENEIRSSVAQVVQLIKTNLKKKNIIVGPRKINDYMWNRGNEGLSPHHRTRTINY